MNAHENLTWDNLKAMFAETRERFNKTEQLIQENARQMKETDLRIEKQWQRWEKEKTEYWQRWENQNEEYRRKREIADEKLDKLFAKLSNLKEKENAEYSRQRKEADEKLDKRFAEISANIEKLNKEYGGISKNNGDMAENFFFNAFRKDKIFMGEKYDRIHKGYFSSVDPYRYEYDIVFFNGTKIAIIEVKYKANPENIVYDELLKRVVHFKKYAKEYKDHQIILGVAAMSFKSGLATELHKKGVATIHPVGKKMIIYDKDVKVY